ncbi:Hypothetical predicted protein [Lynx pardinus]|uniref:Uncharacterized protein n=1 Tax=Lynx pardinus TaxID=191816 RepID=A0A485MXV5_LYNPA|nr:Hypothetical predicted protein [Lynx pardinus]
MGAERTRPGGWRKQSPQLSVEEGGDSAGAESHISTVRFISTARERAWMLKPPYLTLSETSVNSCLNESSQSLVWFLRILD